MELTFITGNESKAKYLSDYFHIPVRHKKLDLPEIQSLDLRSVVTDKALQAYDIIKSPVLVEDVSLTFKQLNTLPGPLVKWFLESLGNEGMCKLLSDDTREAIAEVAFALCDAHGVHIFSGSVEGTIAKSPRGDVGFGWDPIFVPRGYVKTWAEMTDDEKHETSMRKIALGKMLLFLESQK